MTRKKRETKREDILPFKTIIRLVKMLLISTSFSEVLPKRVFVTVIS